MTTMISQKKLLSNRHIDHLWFASLDINTANRHFLTESSRCGTVWVPSAPLADCRQFAGARDGYEAAHRRLLKGGKDEAESVPDPVGQVAKDICRAAQPCST